MASNATVVTNIYQFCTCSSSHGPGYDYINRAEATIGDIFKRAGYDTAHYGKWHNGRTLGYEPWSVGFQDSWLPSSHVHLDNLMRSAALPRSMPAITEQQAAAAAAIVGRQWQQPFSIGNFGNQFLAGTATCLKQL